MADTFVQKVRDYSSWRVVGRTRDDAVGECYDKVARTLGFPYPGGKYLDEAAKKGKSSLYTLPHPRVEGSDLDFSFSGLKTAMINLSHNAKQKGISLQVKDAAAAFQQAVCDMIAPRLMAAAAETGYKTIVLAGGVSANSGIRTRMEAECQKAGCTLIAPPLCYCGDNAAMIAAQGYYEFLAGHTAKSDLNAMPSCPLDTEFAG